MRCAASFYGEIQMDRGREGFGQMFTHLVRVIVEIKILQEARGELTKQSVVRLVDGSQAPVSVVVGAGAGAETTH